MYVQKKKPRIRELEGEEESSSTGEKKKGGRLKNRSFEGGSLSKTASGGSDVKRRTSS